MMNATTRWIMGVFLGLLAMVAVVTLWPERGTDPALKIAGWGAGQKVDRIDEVAPIDSIEVSLGGEQVTLTRKKTGRWMMTPPQGALADRYRIRQILELFREDVASVMSTKVREGNLSEFGLDPAQTTRVTLHQGDSVFATLEIGKTQKVEEGMGEGDSFVRIPGQDRLYRVIGRNFGRPFEGGIKALRDKKAFDFEASDVVAITIEDPLAPEVDRRIQLVAEEAPAAESESNVNKTVWRFVQPAWEKEGDVNSYLSSIANLYVSDYLPQLPPGIEIQQTATRVALKLADAQDIVIRLSDEHEESIYAQVEGIDGYLKLSKHTGESLKKRVADLRAKAPVSPR